MLQLDQRCKLVVQGAHADLRVRRGGMHPAHDDRPLAELRAECVTAPSVAQGNTGWYCLPRDQWQQAERLFVRQWCGTREHTGRVGREAHLALTHFATLRPVAQVAKLRSERSSATFPKEPARRKSARRKLARRKLSVCRGGLRGAILASFGRYILALLAQGLGPDRLGRVLRARLVLRRICLECRLPAQAEPPVLVGADIR